MKSITPLFCFFALTLTAQHNIEFRSNIQYPRILSNLWGYTDTATGKEYALVGEETGMSIVDVSNPDNPFQVFFVPNDTSMWQEPKTWSHYAYMTNERGGGLLIVDLSNLPASVNYTHWSGIPDEDYQTTHTCFIDEKGIIYLNGSNLFHRGVMMCDLKPDPMNPVFLGIFDDFYVHDCFARNDTLYASEIINGTIAIVDVSDKSAPVVLARQQTPFNFSHNVWPTDDNRYLFNTDEKKFAPVTVYDIADLNNIREVEQYRHSDVDSSIPHNTYYRDGYLYTSYYRDGVTICDAHRPDNIVEIGSYDTSPFPSFGGFEGCWGVYPFFPSGNIICSDRHEGLFVLTPTLKRACYLEGNVTDAISGNNLNGITVEIIGNNRLKKTDLFGNYKTGMADSGSYDIRFTDYSVFCNTIIVSDVQLKEAQTTTVNVQMFCSFPSSISQNTETEFSLSTTKTVFTGNTQLLLKNQSGHAANLSVYNISGALVKKFDIDTPVAQIEIGDSWSAGTYFIRAGNQTNHAFLRLIKLN